MKNIMLFLMALLMSSHVLAQQTAVTGVITDSNDGSPLIGASVLVKGTKTGTITDFNGRFTLNMPSEKRVLVVSSVGYKTQEITLQAGQRTLQVVMKEDTEVLDEVVVVGYGTMKKSDLTGSVANLSGDK